MSIPTGFFLPIDIINRALQRVGATKIASLTEDSKNCDETTFCYDKLRQAEYRRNVWRFAIRVAALRPLSNNTMWLVPTAWNNAKSYVPGSLVTYNGIWYICQYANNTALEPDINIGPWEQYFGPRVAQLYVNPNTSPPSTIISYYPGEVVYVLNGSTPTAYMALQPTTDIPGTVDAWVATTTYNEDDTVTGSDTNVYQSLIDFNIDNNPVPMPAPNWVILPVAGQPNTRNGQNWLQLDTGVKSIPFLYPVGSGPDNVIQSRNVFFLPAGFLREAPQNPKAGANTFLGGPTGNNYDDWNFQDDFIVSSETNVIVLRFVADVANVKKMDPMFCEGLACRIGLEVAEALTQSTAKLQAIGVLYKQFMGEARVVNGIETGPTEPPEDDFVTVRM